MVFGMSVETFTFLHVVISLVGIMTGFVVVGLMLQSAPIAGWNAFFLISTILTSVSGYFFPIKGLTPAHVVGAISLITLAVALYAIYGKKLAGRWRVVSCATAFSSLRAKHSRRYNCVCLVQALNPTSCFIRILDLPS